MSTNVEDLEGLIRDFGQVPVKVAKRVTKIMPKTGLAIKKRMQADMRASSSFKQVARTIDYDVNVYNGFGTEAIEVEIGPNASRGGGASIAGMGSLSGGSAASLAGLAYFGGSNGGGGTVTDPRVAMRLEEPIFLGFLQMAVEDLL